MLHCLPINRGNLCLLASQTTWNRLQWEIQICLRARNSLLVTRPSHRNSDSSACQQCFCSSWVWFCVQNSASTVGLEWLPLESPSQVVGCWLGTQISREFPECPDWREWLTVSTQFTWIVRFTLNTCFPSGSLQFWCKLGEESLWPAPRRSLERWWASSELPRWAKWHTCGHELITVEIQVPGVPALGERAREHMPASPGSHPKCLPPLLMLLWILSL